MNQMDSGITNDDNDRDSVKLESSNIRIDFGIYMIDSLNIPKYNKLTSISYNVE
jgi:hypothetical protein